MSIFELQGEKIYSFVQRGLTYGHLSTGVEPKKGEDDGKYIPINTRMQRTQVAPETFCNQLKT